MDIAQNAKALLPIKISVKTASAWKVLYRKADHLLKHTIYIVAAQDDIFISKPLPVFSGLIFSQEGTCRMRAGVQTQIYLTSIIIQLVLLLGPVTSSGAAEFSINSAYDVNDLEPGNGLCVAYLIVFPPFVLPFCTLRAAIEETNGLPGPDTINIPSGNYRLDINGINEDRASTGDLDITDTLLIKGKGVHQTYIDGNGLDRVFDISDPNAKITIEHLTISNGNLPPNLPADHKGGGGIRNRGDLTLRNVALENNLVNGSSWDDSGGGLLNISNCLLKNSTIKENHASTGGGIYNGPDGTLTISSSTINNNDSLSGGGLTNEGTAKIINTTISGNRINTGVHPFGGGIYNISELEILQSTITNNTSKSQGGGVSNEGSLHMTNTIVAGNANTNCYLTQPIESLGNNLEDDNSCLLNTSSDIINTFPKLDSLQNHGGPTLTHGLLIGSPAVDRGQNLISIGITTDQRGVRRPDGRDFDIGAFETRKRSIVPLTVPLLCCGN